MFLAFFQAFALIPGMSRSGTVITALRYLGFGRNTAISFSLLSGIPIILIATIYGIYSLFYFDDLVINTFFLIAFLSFISAYISIRFIIKWVKKFSFKAFVYYRIIIGSLIILYYFN